MWVTDDFIFLELQKCASTRISGIFAEQNLGGRQVGKHDRFSGPVPGRRFIGSVRNPWSWYVSLWAFGCAGRGQIYDRVTGSTAPVEALKRARRAGTAMANPFGVVLRSIRASGKRDPQAWADLYADVTDVGAFQRWLQLTLDPDRSLELDYRYGASGFPRSAGLLTFWYLWLFSRDERAILRARPSVAGDVADLDAAQNQCTYIIRVEYLHTDVVSALEAVGVRLDEAQRLSIARAARTPSNTSEHLPTSAYYDHRLRDLVDSREAFVVAKHGYEFPS